MLLTCKNYRMRSEARTKSSSFFIHFLARITKTNEHNGINSPQVGSKVLLSRLANDNEYAKTVP